jgi:hypothetical protein
MNIKPFEIQLSQLQPSQLYVSSAKLARVENSYTQGDDLVLPPVPIKKLDGHLIYTDGHTRAFAAFINGQETIRAVWDTDELDWEAYQICVQWCREEGVYTIADLQSRILAPTEYQILWLDRCRQMQFSLEERRQS